MHASPDSAQSPLAIAELAAVFRGLSDGWLLVDLEAGRIVASNPAAERLLSAAAGSLEGAPLTQLQGWGGSGGVAQLRQRLDAGLPLLPEVWLLRRAQGAICRCEATVGLCRPGDTRWVYSLLRTPGAPGEPSAGADEAGAGMSQRLIAACPQPLLIADGEGRVRQASAEAERCFSAPPGALVGRLLRALIEPGVVAMRAHRLDGRVFPCEVQEWALDEHASGAKACLVRDLTTEQSAEQRLMRQTRVQQLRASLAQLLHSERDLEAVLRELPAVAADQGDFQVALVLQGEAWMTLRCVASQGGEGEQDDFGLLADLQHPDSAVAAQLVGVSALTVSELSSAAELPDTAARLRVLGVETLILLPLRESRGTSGFLVLGTSRMAPDQAELDQLVGLATDLSAALTAWSQRRQIDFLTLHDPLTGLGNRQTFCEHLQQRLDQSDLTVRQLGVMALDISRFRSLRQALGSAGGDELLQVVGARLAELAERPEAVGRLEGDIFVLMIPDLSGAEELLRFADERVRPALAVPVDVTGWNLSLTVVIGAALCPQDGEDAVTLVQNAEAALLRAHSVREPFHFHTAEISHVSQQRLTLEQRLRQALLQGELQLHYQPRLHLASGRVGGAEGLLRWSEAGAWGLTAADVIRSLEGNGEIVAVGYALLEQAIAAQQRWASRGLPVPALSVNVAVQQLYQPDFVEQVEARLQAAGGLAGPLELEITESALMRDVDVAQRALLRLRELGLGVAIDDFGTGYSSLSYLLKLPATTLKIDRAFIRVLEEQEEARKIVSAIISLAHGLNIKVVAEGLEREAPLALLRRWRCDEVQGFVISPAVPAEAFEAFLSPGWRLPVGG